MSTSDKKLRKQYRLSELMLNVELRKTFIDDIHEAGFDCITTVPPAEELASV